MKQVYAQAIPFDKEFVTLALESGVDALIVDAADRDKVLSLAKAEVLTPEEFAVIALDSKDDEAQAVAELQQGRKVILKRGFEIIPVENILAQGKGLGVEVHTLEEAEVAAGILEVGVDFVVVPAQGAAELKQIVSRLKLSQGTMDLETATVTAIETAGLGHRVCVDTMSMLRTGQGMLVGNSSAFTVLVHAETESNPYVAARPFRVNAGAVHAYAVMPGDKTTYLEELSSGAQVLIVDGEGTTSLATVGRVKVEVRPMLLITARAKDGTEGKIFLQNAETIRVVRPDGSPVSVVALEPGDDILVRVDEAGRHFGMRIKEDIRED